MTASSLHILTCRPDAGVEAGLPGYIACKIVLVKEVLSLSGRSTSLGAKSEITFRPGVLYRAYTGLVIPSMPSTACLDMRASKSAWDQAGLEVLRVDADPESKELQVSFRVQSELVFRRVDRIFEFAYLPALVTGYPPQVTVGRASNDAPIPGIKVHPEQKHLQAGPAVVEAPEATKTAQNSEEADRARVAQWLAEDDPKGRVIEHEEIPQKIVLATDAASGVAVPDAAPGQRVDDSQIATYGSPEPSARAQQIEAYQRGQGEYDPREAQIAIATGGVDVQQDPVQEVPTDISARDESTQPPTQPTEDVTHIDLSSL